MGGLGDVVRDLPVALASRGWAAGVVTPSYGVLAQLPGARRCADIEVNFAGSARLVGLYEVPGDSRMVTHHVLDHPLFALTGPGRIYTDDDAGPFATDATKFAFYCVAACAALARGALPVPSVLHLHDWQTALVLLLRANVPEFSPLRAVRTVYTIHNLAMQGVRPLRGHDSALETWYPDLEYDERVAVDPRWADCVNPMAIGIRLADAINTVSPTYAREILTPSDPARGYSGGEGLEDELRSAKAAGKLTGILNGCIYPEDSVSKPTWEEVVGILRAEVRQLTAREPSVRSAHHVADERIAALPAGRPTTLLTSIGRVTEQKVRLFRERTKNGASALEAILAGVGPGGLLVMVGSGARDYERFFSEIAASHERFLFVEGYSETLAQSLYAIGDLFLMPSAFEPCGISQMLAMRAGQLCVVHGVGGLRDTVTDNVNGFVFDGETPTEQADAFVARVEWALDLRRSSVGRWQRMQQAAAGMRFDWAQSAVAYETSVYGFGSARK